MRHGERPDEGAAYEPKLQAERNATRPEKRAQHMPPEMRHGERPGKGAACEPRLQAERNATQRNATQRNATQNYAEKLLFVKYLTK